jgi:hypothetical protein
VGLPWIVDVLGAGWLFWVVGLVLRVDFGGYGGCGEFVVAGGGRWIVDLVEQIFLFFFFYSGLKKKKKKLQ